jgi:tRNA(fMet)-specific endonuclease VapC
MGVIIDTSVLVAAERKRFDLPAFLAEHSGEELRIAAITASELLHGCLRAAPQSRREKRALFVEDAIRDCPMASFALAEAREHARLWVELETKGSMIGPHDLLIAATAVTLEFSLATLNVAEFQRVPGLRLLDVARFQRPVAGQS